MKTIAIMNDKRGVGKTVTAINLAEILVKEHQKRVVLVDCDGQMNLTRFFFPEFEPERAPTVADVLTREHEPYWRENVIQVCEGLDLLPGSPALYDLDLLAIRDRLGDPYALERFCGVADYDGEADYFIFDCPPGYTLASVSALIAAEEVIVPMPADGLSFGGIMDIKRQLERFWERLTCSGPQIGRVLVTQWQDSERVRQGAELLKQMGIPAFKTVIRSPTACRIGSAATTQDYQRWVQEYLEGWNTGGNEGEELCVGERGRCFKRTRTPRKEGAGE